MEKNSRQGYFLQWLIGVGDLVLINALFLVLYRALSADYTRLIGHSLKEIILLLNFCYFFALYFVPVRVHLSVVFLDNIVKRSFMLITFQMIMFTTCLIFMRIGHGSARFLIILYGTLLVAFSLWRVVMRVIVKIYRRKGYSVKNVIIVGAGKNGLELYKVLKNDMAYGFNVYGFFDDNEALRGELPNYLGQLKETEAFIETHPVDEIYCTIPGANSEKISGLLSFAEKHMIRFYILPDFYRDIKKSMVMEIMEYVPLLSIRNEPLQSASNRAVKRAFDILFSSLVMLLLYPILYLVIGLLIKLSSPGPILFKQKRTGLYGKEFDCYKFRTMRVNKEADEKQATRDDPRTTPIGAFLRHTNLDEIPQFVNVLKGDMSVVGPRPHMLKHTEQYSKLIDKYMVRHLVKPGITGWAQITGYRGETKTLEQMEGRVKRDVWYIENWSFFLDLKIIYVTVINMFQGEKNAY